MMGKVPPQISFGSTSEVDDALDLQLHINEIKKKKKQGNPSFMIWEMLISQLHGPSLSS